MDTQKKKAISEIIVTLNDLDLSSVMLLANGASMLRAKEKLDLATIADKQNTDESNLRVG